MKNPYIKAIERRLDGGFTVPVGLGVLRSLNQGERELLTDLLKEFQKIDRKFSIPFVSKLRKIADQCEAGGHKSRARMFRAVAKEFEVTL
jgi:hypothetical protein